MRCNQVFVEFNQNNESAINFSHVFQPGAIDLDDETAQVSGELGITGSARKNEAVAEVAGRIVGKLDIACHRCLNPLEVTLDVQFEDNFVTLDIYEKSSAEHQIGGADLDVSVYDGERIDIAELAREQILLNIPARQLCVESCAGLCEKCGANKNTEDCQCKSEDVDPRWNALKELKIQK
jgi:uncharacterized protein